MASRGVFYLVTLALFTAGALLIGYRHFSQGIPFLPGQQQELWTVEAKIEFEPEGTEPVTVSFALPAQQPGFTQLRQSTASLGYGVSYLNKKGSSYVEWTRRELSGPQVLFYRAYMLVDPSQRGSSMKIPALTESTESEPYATAIREIAHAAAARSADPFSYAAQVIRELNQQTELTELLTAKYQRPRLLVRILEDSGVPAREIGVLNLEDGRRNRGLISKVAVFKDSAYEIFDPQSGSSGLAPGQLIWSDSGGALLEIAGGGNARVSFSMLKENIPAEHAGTLRARLNRGLSENLSLSLHNLPVEEQALFKSILLLPVGVIIVVFLRIIAGIKTSGTFMPVLIAMSFLETSLTVGLIGFVSVVGAGLIVRSWLSRLNLLLVARISAVIIVVIAIIGSVSFFTYQLGLTEGMKITFFPMIILSWTIERMSILWEEEGYKEVLVQGSGSIVTAVAAYLAMNSALISHLTFHFLGLQLVLLSLILLMGNYTGFRLSELRRFKPLVPGKEAGRRAGPAGESEAARLKRDLKELKRDPHRIYEKWRREARVSPGSAQPASGMSGDDKGGGSSLPDAAAGGDGASRAGEGDPGAGTQPRPESGGATGGRDPQAGTGDAAAGAAPRPESADAGRGTPVRAESSDFKGDAPARPEFADKRAGADQHPGSADRGAAGGPGAPAGGGGRNSPAGGGAASPASGAGHRPGSGSRGGEDGHGTV